MIEPQMGVAKNVKIKLGQRINLHQQNSIQVLLISIPV
jgi:hypothetical protein